MGWSGLVIIGMLFIIFLPIWSYSKKWGRLPSIALGALLIAYTLYLLIRPMLFN